MKINELIDEAVSLPAEERARMVDSLLQTFNRLDDAHAATWLNLAGRRLGELRSGKVQAVPGEEVFERVRSRIGA